MGERVSELDVGNLNEVARVLATAAQGFEATSADAPELPDAGASTGSIAELLAAIADVMATVSKSAAVAADTVQANLGSYEETDQGNGQQFLDVTGLVLKPTEER